MNNNFKNLLLECIEYDEHLKAGDFNQTVVVKHGDGSEFKINHATIEMREINGVNILTIFSEHNVPLLFYLDDIESYKVMGLGNNQPKAE